MLVEVLISLALLAVSLAITYRGPLLQAIIDVGIHAVLRRPELLSFLRPSSTSQAMRVGNRLSVSYTYRGATYTVLLPYTDNTRRWIVRAIAKTPRGDEDVTNTVKTFAGPCQDFFGLPVTPVQMVRGCTSLLISYNDGTHTTRGPSEAVV